MLPVLAWCKGDDEPPAPPSQLPPAAQVSEVSTETMQHAKHSVNVILGSMATLITAAAAAGVGGTIALNSKPRMLAERREERRGGGHVKVCEARWGGVQGLPRARPLAPSVLAELHRFQPLCVLIPCIQFPELLYGVDVSDSRLLNRPRFQAAAELAAEAHAGQVDVHPAYGFGRWHRCWMGMSLTVMPDVGVGWKMSSPVCCNDRRRCARLENPTSPTASRRPASWRHCSAPPSQMPGESVEGPTVSSHCHVCVAVRPAAARMLSPLA